MTGLPSSIETYLQESGFSATEILVLRKLLEGQALTLREIASRTGKSTGVLDQAARKLLRRGIVTRENVNDTSKYTVTSLESISAWMRRDMQSKREQLLRREQDFASFVASLQMEKGRPEMEHFEGEQGIEKAYQKLLGFAEGEMLHYVPVRHREEDDPLRDFRVQYFRRRHKLGVFSRVLAPDTPLGRRYQSRDAFEYRETVLLPEDRYPVDFEKIIAGDVIACFNHREQRACFLHYPELAQSERQLFGMLWRNQDPSSPDTVVVSAADERPKIGLETLTLSALREFLVSRKSIAAMALCSVLAAAVTYGLYRQNYNLNLQRVRDRVMAIAATAAPEFDPDDLDQLRTWRDVEKPAYQRVLKLLQNIKDRNPGLHCVYIFRTTDDPYILEFVADLDSPDIFNFEDINKDGLRNDVLPPGYSIADSGWVKYNMAEKIFNPGGYADEVPYTDFWGTWITGHAVILRSDGTLAGILGVDIDASEIQKLTFESFRVIYVFAGLFVLFVFVRLAAFNQSLFRELLKLLCSRAVLCVLLACALLAFLVTYGMYRYTLGLMKEQVGERLLSIAVMTAPTIDAEDLAELHIAQDMQKAEYQRVFEKLNEIKDAHPDIGYMYILRPTEDTSIWEWVVDADSNYFIPHDGIDYNKDGVIDAADVGVAPGVSYYAGGQIFSTKGLSKPLLEDFAVDQWGTFLTGFAPIQNAEGEAVAVVGVDIEVSDLIAMVRSKFQFYFWFFGIFTLSLITLILFLVIRAGGLFAGSKGPSA